MSQHSFHMFWVLNSGVSPDCKSCPGKDFKYFKSSLKETSLRNVSHSFHDLFLGMWFKNCYFSSILTPSSICKPKITAMESAWGQNCHQILRPRPNLWLSSQACQTRAEARIREIQAQEFIEWTILESPHNNNTQKLYLLTCTVVTELWISPGFKVLHELDPIGRKVKALSRECHLVQNHLSHLFPVSRAFVGYTNITLFQGERVPCKVPILVNGG